jgi:SAM-dependent methyltransferase
MNTNPNLSQFEDNSFDVICNVVSVDYLTKPLEIFQEMHRIAMWLQADDIGRLTIVGSYYNYSADWKSIEALDIKEKLPVPERPSTAEIMKNPSLGLAWMTAAGAVQKNNGGDPMYVVKGVK